MLFARVQTGRRVCRSSWLAALATTVGVSLLSGCGSSDKPAATPSDNSIITSTTRIASAGVLGNDRRPDESCAPEPAALDEGPPEREVGNATGHAVTPPLPETTLVRADPQRIVALAGDQLDALCALGLQSRIVAAALPDGSVDQPSYLGTVISELPGAGSRSDPDLDAIAAVTPDLILGSVALTPGDFPALSEIAPTVFDGPPGVAWRDNLRTVGAATGRLEAANALIEAFDRAADKTGADNDATHFQASVVQFTDTTMRVFGADNFPAGVLADVGVDRPAAQRFTDKPYIEVGISNADLGDSPDFSIADGDIVYLSFATAEARQRAPEVMDSDAWKRLSANRDNRVFAVNNEVWQTGDGIVAARGILADLRWVNAPIN
ncbi:Fe3+-citrate ABC transporter substrate-binding protein [Mycolicibacterium cyprinidarum]|uniref:Fe3+-citrate ABC transporter substrate-binding protein n=1 Tax=Mycolicibacterium cyprinidarum TaxID=2860311 RepID=A0ABQ4V7H4_9MYCO|nr:Fe3+-citrate ABC transporter substrate-binding protein [Mycolicibacterium sp. NGTWSNA01]GJF12804.1 Fe3+-citrate ABC transporter substrate-binding protein [Mycolicibacterium sp. NGTWS1803]GJF14698.1 Fe3+-citrate ABC transporter substrate-binding protein [Mycolicibacterium sp. NGTWS0302]